MCDQKGRDCIKGNSTKTYNCSATCVGIYADVQRKDLVLDDNIVGKEAEKTPNSNEITDIVRREVMKMKRSEKGKTGAGNSEKYRMLVAEYRKFKEKNVKHFRLNPCANSNAFGEFKYQWFNINFAVYSR